MAAEVVVHAGQGGQAASPPVVVVPPTDPWTDPTTPGRMHDRALGDGSSRAYAEMMTRYLGPDVMRALENEDVVELYVNPQDRRVRLDTHSRGRIDAGFVIGAERLEMFLNAAATAVGTPLTAQAPALQAELPLERFGGARLQGFIPPATPAATIVIRKRPTRAVPLDEYVARGIMPDTWRGALGDAIDARWTIVVAGGTGTGKSTLLGALLHEIATRCPGERVAVLEDTVELRCPVPDHLPLRTTPALSLAALVKATLRTSPTRIVIGEVRDASALDFLDAAVTGHPGGLCTVHASGALGALHRLDRLAQRANVPPQPALVAEAVDLVVVLMGHHSQRRVADLVRVTGLDARGRYLLHRCTERGTWDPVETV